MANDLQTLTSRTTNKEFSKRDVKLVDRSNKEINLTLWGAEASKFDGSLNPVVALKGVKVGDFGGCNLSTVNNTILQINPDMKEAHILKGWYDREGCNTDFQVIGSKLGTVPGGMGGQWKSFAQTVGEQLGMGDKPDYYMNKATVVMVRKENCMYMACPAEDCNKKVIDMNNGLYRCEKCGQEYGNFKWRLLFNVNIADYSEGQWVTCFQEAAETLLSVKAEELGSIKESDEDNFNNIIANATFKSYIFKLRTKMETFNEESRMKTTVVVANPVDPVIFGRKVLSDIKQLLPKL